jgi:hypothetical protein
MPKKGVSVYTRNTQRLYELWYRDEKIFRAPLLEIWSDFGFDTLLDSYEKWWFKLDLKNDGSYEVDGKKSNERSEKFDRWVNLVLAKLSKSNKKELNLGLLSIADKNNLGFEWMPCLRKIVMFLYFDPPMHNFSISTNKKLGVFSIVMNPYTTVEDLKSASDIIESEKEKFFGNKKQYYFRKGLIGDIDIVNTFESAGGDKDRFFDPVEYEYFKPTMADKAESLFPDNDEDELDYDDIVKWQDRAKKRLNNRKKI